MTKIHTSMPGSTLSIMLPFLNLTQKFQYLFRSAQPNQQGQISIGPKQIYILPTRFGVMFGALILSMLTGSINYANNLGYLLTFFLASIGIMTILHTWRNLLDLTLSIDPIKPVFSQQNFLVNFNIKNKHNRLRGAIQLSLEKNHADHVIEDIQAYQTKCFSLPVKAHHRGIFQIKKFVLSTQYPFGLLRAWVYLNVSINVLVYPKPSSHFNLPFIPIDSFNHQGDKGTGSDDFVAHRNYQMTDSPRLIDWKVFAREKGLMSKQFGGDQKKQIWLNFDLFPNEPVELILSKLTRLILNSESNQIKYGLKIPGKTLNIHHGNEHQQQCLKALALFHLGHHEP